MDIVGFLYLWGVTIDTLSCINIVLAIGLCVDYSAHIAHAFIVSEGKYSTYLIDHLCIRAPNHFTIAGTKEDRAIISLKTIGPAVINGGITTFLALVLLGFSQSHVFITFFKVRPQLRQFTILGAYLLECSCRSFYWPWFSDSSTELYSSRSFSALSDRRKSYWRPRRRAWPLSKLWKATATRPSS